MAKIAASQRRSLRARRASASKPELLEKRQMLSVSLNAQGWSVITPPAGARIIYCSSSQGNDSNSGLSPNSPVASLGVGESLLRSGTGDELLLKCGDVFHGNFIFWTKSGKDAQDPIVLGSYGSGARPEIMTGTQMGLETGSVGAPVVNYLAVVGINFDANGRDPTLTNSPATTTNPSAIQILTKSTGILVENCEFKYYTVDLTFQDYLGPISNVTVRRNTIIDSYSGNTHSQGLYATGVTNLTIDGNLFDQDGYNLQLGIPQTVFNQDCYLAYDDVNCVVENNIFSRAASTGLEDRPGGIVENNVFIDDPVGMTFGLVNGALTTAGGVSGDVIGNVFFGGANIGSFTQGYGLEIGNTKPGGGTVISNNIISQGGVGGAPAITLQAGKAQIDPQDSVGVNDLMIAGNVINQWSTGIAVVSGLTPGGRGLTAFNDVTIKNNEFQNLTTASIENHSASYASQETISNNSYYNADHWLINDALVPAQGNILSHPMAFPNAGASVAGYDAALGNSGSTGDFLTRVAQFSEANWNTSYGADGLVSYFEQGFGLPMTTSAPVITPPVVTPPVTTPPVTTPPVTTPPVTTPPVTTPPGDSASRSATSPIQAVSYNAHHGTVADGFGGMGTNGGAWAEYAAVDFGAGVSSFTANIAGLAKYAGTVQLRLDSPSGTLIGSLKIAGTGAWNKYVAQTTSVKGATGVHNLYLVFVGAGGTGNFSSFVFTPSSTTSTATSRPATSTIQATSYNAQLGIAPDGVGQIGTNGGDWAEYSQVNFGAGVSKFTAQIAALAKYAGTVQIRLDSPTGKLVGSLKIAGTGAWNKYVAQTANVSGASGIHNLYLVFVGGGGVGNVASFKFS
ncbi:MAG TPA: carbohydrate-binding protein [Tepidisphaeraceae bacterium]|jgi:hypothetical protein|nr:carbohydrate-binding protein [Tepidisphaeraceae bacterium]